VLRVRTIAGAGADEVVCPGVEEPNLVSRALQRLRARGWDAPRVRIEIRKRVPIAAGMGGGSADAAATLRLAQQLGRITGGLVAELAQELGADVPSQVAPGLTLGTGAGDVIEPVASLAPHALLILPLDKALSTADVYREADRLGLPREAAELASLGAELRSSLRPGAELPSRLLVNDLQPAAIVLCPEIEPGLDAAREAGAEHAVVCGSGPTVAGLFWGAEAPARAATAAGALATRYPGAASATPVSAEFGLPLFAEAG
jgi:4-diphosphocytidyl-2-C-methyl-D-erythritol kinase